MIVLKEDFHGLKMEKLHMYNRKVISKSFKTYKIKSD